MSEIATYFCSNQACKFTVHISKDFPQWRSDTPHTLRSLKVTKQSLPFVEKFRSEYFCLMCKKVRDHNGSPNCTTCAQKIHDDSLQYQCPQCNRGVFAMRHLIVR